MVSYLPINVQREDASVLHCQGRSGAASGRWRQRPQQTRRLTVVWALNKEHQQAFVGPRSRRPQRQLSEVAWPQRDETRCTCCASAAGPPFEN